MHLTRSIRFIVFFFINFGLFISCSKEEDNNLPSVRIELPLENSSFLVGDTVHIKATASDDRNIRKVVIELKDENNIPVLAKQVNASSSYVEVDETFPLSDKSLSGRYYIDVRAYDDSDFGSSFRFINIVGQKKKINSFFVYSEQGSACKVFKVNAEKKLIATLHGDLLESAIDLNEAILYSCGQFQGDLNAIDTAGNLLWTHSSSRLPQVPYFNDLQFYENNVFAALNDGRVIGYDNKGNRFLDLLIDQNGLPIHKILRQSDWLLYQFGSNPSIRSGIANAYYPSGKMVVSNTFLYGEIEGFHSMTGYEVLIFSNTPAQQFILKYDSKYGILKELSYVFDKGSISASSKISDTEVVYQQGNDLFVFDLTTESSVLIKGNFKSTCLRMDINSEILWSAYDTEIIGLRISDWTEIKNIQVDEVISSFEVFSSY